jgi:hypothetical protein
MPNLESATAREPLRVLALDHYFDQDLEALEAHPALSLRRLPFQRLRRPAIRMMGEAVGTGLEYFTRPELAEARERYARWLDKALRKIFLEDPFHLILLPSDAFFFVRALPDVAHSIGVPVVVVQKETTIPPAAMDNETLAIGRYAPFISDWMTVCSERQKEFWARAGADPARITVIGQPRFDIYRDATPPKKHSGLRTVLFFSYAVDTYAPEADLGEGTWTELREQTEEVLADLARCGAIRVVVKPHPQQSRRGERDRLRAVAGTAWENSFLLAGPETDTRQLVLDSDLAVGFQSTALYEAVAARRPVVYAAWGDAWERRVGQLIPFHAAPPGCLYHAKRPEALRALLQMELQPPARSARVWYEEGLGPIDGRATDRAVDVLIGVANRYPSGSAQAELLRRRRRHAAQLLVRSAAAEVFWLAARLPAVVLGRSAGVIARQHQARAFYRLARQGLNQGPRLPWHQHQLGRGA